MATETNPFQWTAVLSVFGRMEPRSLLARVSTRVSAIAEPFQAWRYALGTILLVTFVGCGGLSPHLSADQVRGVRGAPKDANRCTVAATHREPLVTEWSASSKARLEILLAATVEDTDRYAVAVEYAGCELRIIDSCQSPAAYDWSRSTLSRDTVDINDADDLYAKLPLGAVALEGALKRSGHLSIQTTVAGQIRLKRDSIDFDAVAADPGCAEATHVIQAVSIGAFRMIEGGRGQARVGAAVVGIGRAGGSTSRTEQLVREAGSDADCQQTTKGEPHPGCRSPLQLFLLPIPHSAQKIALAPNTVVKPTTQKPRKNSALRTLGYILGGVGIAGLGGGTASMIMSGATATRIKDGTYATPEDITSAHGSFGTSRVLGAGGLISGGVLLGLAVPLFVLGGK